MYSKILAARLPDTYFILTGYFTILTVLSTAIHCIFQRNTVITDFHIVHLLAEKQKIAVYLVTV